MQRFAIASCTGVLAAVFVLHGALAGETPAHAPLPLETPRPPGEGTVYSIDPATGAETVVHSFGSGKDGKVPYDGLIETNGLLYGTTLGGGARRQGTVFSIDPLRGTETIVYSFAGKTDGAKPVGGLIDVNGTLYGTTSEGGGTGCTRFRGCGTVFSINLDTGAETVLHAFGSGTDGIEPFAGLNNVNGTLYGTTAAGGANGHGTVYSIDSANGAEAVLHSFAGADGEYPEAGLLDVNGILYGTTYGGGAHARIRGGTVFSIDPATGTETVVHSFCSLRLCADGAKPMAPLIDVNGTLYGTTLGGSDRGKVFSLDPATGAEAVFRVPGRHPIAGLIKVKGLLYTTTSGRPGTVFSLDPATAAENVLHTFGSNGDGAKPGARLLDVNGTLYGTTLYGGAY